MSLDHALLGKRTCSMLLSGYIVQVAAFKIVAHSLEFLGWNCSVVLSGHKKHCLVKCHNGADAGKIFDMHFLKNVNRN